SLDISYGYTGDAIRITGKNFGTDKTALTVKINGVATPVLMPNSPMIISECSVKIPAHCGTGAVTVSRNGKTATGPVFYYIPSTTLTTLYGLPSAPNTGFVNGTGTNMRMQMPVDFVFDKSNNIYVADKANNGSLLRKINGSTGVISTFSGGPLNGNTANFTTYWTIGLPAGSGGNSDVNGGQARFHLPYGIGISEGSGGVFKLFVGESSFIRVINEATATGVFAGNKKDSASTGSHENGGRFDARITVTGPPVIVPTPGDYGSPTIYFLDGTRVAKQDVAGNISTFADIATLLSKGNLTRLADGSFYMGSMPLYKISQGGTVSTYFKDSDSLLNKASGKNEVYRDIVSFYCKSMDMDKDGNLWIISTSGYHNSMVKIYPDKSFLRMVIWTAGTDKDGVNGLATLNGPAAMHIRDNGEIYLIDGTAIRKMTFE
ncbi:MAG: IPT/TIG domain-containing protein, partial [Bacteroidota bacterium]